MDPLRQIWEKTPGFRCSAQVGPLAPQHPSFAHSLIPKRLVNHTYGTPGPLHLLCARLALSPWGSQSPERESSPKLCNP